MNEPKPSYVVEVLQSSYFVEIRPKYLSEPELQGVILFLSDNPLSGQIEEAGYGRFFLDWNDDVRVYYMIGVVDHGHRIFLLDICSPDDDGERPTGEQKTMIDKLLRRAAEGGVFVVAKEAIGKLLEYLGF